ncbi:MAG TPA: flagellar motor protein [Cyanobacteria bacterium UBA9971]|nr:flagellar motor protein [Cyanobacteria bacterium UBA9971]
MDLTSLIGPIAGITLIMLAYAMEGGTIGSLIQITAAMIVFGGTFGAVIFSFSQEQLLSAMKATKRVFFIQHIEFKEIIAEIVRYATKARKEGVIVLEKEAKNASDSLIKLGLEAVSDGADPSLVRDLMETQLAQMEASSLSDQKVWEAAGAYSPTFGIIGAVMGLIQVMKNLSDPSALGAGIAVAFVATIYGLIGANLVFIPINTKIKNKDHHSFLAKQMMIEGILSIQAGESPALIERKLQAFILEEEASHGGKKSSEEVMV